MRKCFPLFWGVKQKCFPFISSNSESMIVPYSASKLEWHNPQKAQHRYLLTGPTTVE